MKRGFSETKYRKFMSGPLRETLLIRSANESYSGIHTNDFHDEGLL